MAPQLGVFFREALQLRGRVRLVLSAFGLRIEYSVFNAIIFIVIVILLAFERRVESRRRRHGTKSFLSKPTRVWADQALPASGGDRQIRRRAFPTVARPPVSGFTGRGKARAESS